MERKNYSIFLHKIDIPDKYEIIIFFKWGFVESQMNSGL